MFFDKKKTIGIFDDIVESHWNPEIDKLIVSSIIALVVGFLLWFSVVPKDKILVKYSIILSITSSIISFFFFIWHLLTYKKRTNTYKKVFEIELEKISNKSKAKLDKVWDSLMKPLYNIFKDEIKHNSDSLDFELQKKYYNTLIESGIFEAYGQLEYLDIRAAIRNTSSYSGLKHPKINEFVDNLALKYRYTLFYFSLFFLIISIITSLL